MRELHQKWKSALTVSADMLTVSNEMLTVSAGTLTVVTHRARWLQHDVEGKVDIRLPGKWEFKLLWRKTGLLNSSRRLSGFEPVGCQ